jgi:hypothetical protein
MAGKFNFENTKKDMAEDKAGARKMGGGKTKPWENSPADKKVDKAGAKGKGISLKKWEGSPADEKVDRKMAAKGRFGK